MKPKKIPFDFVLEYLYPMELYIKPMFGMSAIYAGDKILLMLRQQEKNPQANGVWVAVATGQRDALKKEIPGLHTVTAYEKNPSETEWLLLRPEDDHFENDVHAVCTLIKRQDQRIGRIPKKQKPAGSSKTTRQPRKK